MSFQPNMTRRQVLQLLASTAAASSLPWLSSRSAMAQGDDVPLRVLFVDLHTGILRGDWEPTAEDGGPATTQDWTLRGPYTQLERWKSRLNIFSELDMVSAPFDPTDPDNAHIGGLTHQLVADNRVNGNGSLSGNVSIDQLIAQRLNTPEPVTVLPSLEVAAQEHGHYDGAPTYTAPGQRTPYLSSPVDAYNRLFPDPLGDDLLRAARRQHVATMVRGEYDRLLARLGREDRTKIEQMRDLRNELHQRLSIDNIRATNRPSRAILDPYNTLDDRYQRGSLENRRWSVKTDLMIKLTAAALHTDSTRVASILIGNPPDYEFGYTNGQYGTTDWHDLDHKVSGDHPELTDPNAVAAIREMQRLRVAKFASLLEELERLRETDGQSLLDHTLIVVTSHIAEGSHDLTRLPWLTVGDAHGYLRTGLHTRFPLEGDGDPNSSSHRIWILRGRPHNDLFVTVANAMGVNINAFGNPDVSTGPISEIVRG